MVKNSPGNDNGAARVDGRRSGASRGECVRGWGRNNVFRRRHFYRAPPLYPSLLLFPMLYVNCTVKSHYIRAQCVHYTPCQKHFYPLEFFSSSIHLLSLSLASLAPFFFVFFVRCEHSLNLFVRATQRSNLFHQKTTLGPRYANYAQFGRSVSDFVSVFRRSYPTESLPPLTASVSFLLHYDDRTLVKIERDIRVVMCESKSKQQGK